MMQAGSRVTWFSDEDCWGTVTAVAPGSVTVQWDGTGTTRTHESWQVRFRHNMQVVLITPDI